MIAAAALSWEPACFDPPELEEWRAGIISACAHCLPSWHDSSEAANRCNGIPGYTFRAVEEDEEMNEPEPVTTNALAIRRRTALDVQPPPCGSCLQEPVCSLRAALEGVAEIETSALPLPGGLRLSLVASVECEHFLRDKAKPAPVRVLTSRERGAANHAAAVRASKPSTADWTPERRAAQGERMRARAEALRVAQGAAAG